MKILGFLGEPKAVRASPYAIVSEWRSGWYHDAAAVLVEDGVVVAAIEEERLSRRKHSGKFPYLAIEHCLRARGLTLDDIDYIAYGEEGGVGTYRDASISEAHIATLLAARFPCRSDLADKIVTVEHHIGHAMSAFIPSGFARALVMTADGFGDGVAGRLLAAAGKRITILDSISTPSSLGAFYAAVVSHIGFGPKDEYKVMGLAPYGDTQRFHAFFDTQVTLLRKGRFEIDPGFERALATLGEKRAREAPVERVHMDLAAGVQRALEEIYFHVLSYARKAHGHTNLCPAGGTAQNCTVNGKLLRSGMFANVFVQPASHDAGVPLGAALFVDRLLAPARRARPAKLEHVYWGAAIDESAIGTTLESWSDFVTAERSADVFGATAQHLADGEVVGWVQGRSEFGPRALGNRSILADPRPSENKDRINSMVKKREAFRPFAPSVLVEEAARYFELAGADELPFMTFTTTVHPEKRRELGAVTHVDGTARVQTVSHDTNERFWRLLRAFADRTGVPILLNTSFNNNVEPIVDSIVDALVCFLTTGLDRLVIGEHVIQKRTVSPVAYLSMALRLPIEAVVSRGTDRETDAPLHSIMLREQTHTVPISELMCRALVTTRAGQTMSEVLRDLHIVDEAQRTAIAAELFMLWSARAVILTPVRAR